MPAAELVPGDEVRSVQGNWLRVESSVWTGKRETVYNLEVADYHTYFVGELGVWVHNSCAADPNGSLKIIVRDGGDFLDVSKIRIPGPRNAPQGKIDYLMGRVDSVKSRGKGKFFREIMEFTDETLEAALKRHLQDHFGGAQISGKKIRAYGEMTGPTGKVKPVKTVWQIAEDGGAELITAHKWDGRY